MVSGGCLARSYSIQKLADKIGEDTENHLVEISKDWSELESY